MVRLGGCLHNPETVILAHIRRGHFGMGCKPHDICAVYACAACHRAIDQQTNEFTREEIDSTLLRALCEQLTYYVEKQIITIKGYK